MGSIRSLLEILPAILPLVITEGKVRKKFDGVGGGKEAPISGMPW